MNWIAQTMAFERESARIMDRCYARYKANAEKAGAKPDQILSRREWQKAGLPSGKFLGPRGG